MMLDARLDETRLDRDVGIVIVGAGPAGVVLARDLAGVSDVMVIEAGGVSEADWLLEGESAGLGYQMETARARQLGGSSALWAGYCAALGAEDFATQARLPLSGWPIDETVLAPFYHRASEAIGVAPETVPAGRAGFDAKRLEVGRWTFAKSIRRFAEDVPALAAMPGVDVMTDASVVDIALLPDQDSVSHVLIRTATGREGRIRCKQLVLACGGIETPRLLLAANRQLPAGIGNAGGMVGRCFMEHPHRIMRGVRLNADELFERSAHRRPHCSGQDEMLNFGLPAELRQQLGLLNARAHAFRPAMMEEGEAPQLGLMMEQAPNPASRITLSARTDRVGLPLARLDWQLTELDHRSFATTAAIVADELAAAGLAEIWAREETSAAVGYCCHQLGTTRMSADPEDGVTDLNCRVHGVDNLHIAGGSVFATSGWANPTFTVLALAFRLADRLKGLPGMTAATRNIADRELVS